jgi:hypothetical protein
VSEFGIRLDAAADPDEIARITGLPPHSVRRELAQGFLARGLTRGTAERMVAELKSAGLDATVQPDAPGAPRIDPLRTQQGFAAIAPPKVTEPIHGAPPRATLNAPPPVKPASPPVDRRPPARRASGPQPSVTPRRQRVTQPVRTEARLTPPTLLPAPAPPARTPWFSAGALIILSGVLVAWAWSGRDAAINALRQAEKAYAAKNYAVASAAAERASNAGAEPWATRLKAAIKAGPRVDSAEARLARGDVRGAQQDLIAARAIAPDDRRTLQLILRMREASAFVAAPASAPPSQAASTAPESFAPTTPRSAASVAPESAAPESVAPESAAPKSVAPESAAPESAASAAPKSAAPASAAPESVAPASVASAPPVKLAYPPTRGAKDRSTIARLKVVCATPGEIMVNGKATRQLVPGWVEVKPGRHKLAVRDGNGRVFGMRKVKVAAGRRATVRLRDE